MKKFFTLAIVAVSALFANAAVTDLDAVNDVPYLKATAVQVGTTADIQLCVKHDAATEDNMIGTVVGTFQFPAGVTINSVNGVGATTFNELNNKVVLGGCEASTDGVVATVNVTIPADMDLGDFEMSFIDYQIVEISLADYTGSAITTTLTVKRTATIEALPAGYALEVIPFVAQEGENNINIMFQAPETMKDVEFDITLPKGMFLYDSNFDSTLPTIVDDAVAVNGTTGTTNTITATDEQTAHVKVAGNKLKKTGLAAATTPVVAFTLTALVMDDETAEGVDEAYKYVHNSIQELKISNISMGNVAGTVTYTKKEYIASVIFGVPTDTDPVLYGHFTNDAATNVAAAATNFASVDMSAAKVDNEATVSATLDGILVYGPTQTRLTRTTANYGTVCVPFELTSGDLYEVAGASASSISLNSVTSVAANTPAVFKGNLVAAADGYQLAKAPVAGATVNGLTLTGTYETIKITSGYFIGENKFWAADATPTTVKAFRAYFDGSIAGVRTLGIEDVTGINGISTDAANEGIFDLQGRQLNKAQKGVYIINGKKALVK